MRKRTMSNVIARGPDEHKMHNMKMAGVPESPWDEVVSRLWLGSSEMAYPRDEFDAVVSVFDWHYDREAWLPPQGIPHLVMPFYDSSSIPDKKWFDVITTFIHTFHSNGNSVLIRCQAGLNRSSLVAAVYLCEEYGLGADIVIDMIRGARSQDCLFNMKFENWLRETYREVDDDNDNL